MIDVEKRFPWLKGLAPGETHRIGDVTVDLTGTSAGEGPNGFMLGGGAFTVPLPVKWEFVPDAPFRGFVRAPHGLMMIELDSHHDPAAARGEAKILDYCTATGRATRPMTPAQALESIHIGFVPEGEGNMTWLWLEPLADTHLRVLRVVYPCLGDETAEFRKWLAGAVVQWLYLGSFSKEFEAIDSVAHSAELERYNFQDTVLLRIPRGWKVAENDEQDGRILYTVDEPEDRETLWVQSALTPLAGERDEDRAAAFRHLAEGTAHQVSPVAEGWSQRRVEAGENEILVRAERPETERGEALRRITWVRVCHRGDVAVTLIAHLCTVVADLGREEQRWSAATMETELRKALVRKPTPRFQPRD